MDDLNQVNGPAAAPSTQTTAERDTTQLAAQWLENALAVNLDEVDAEPVTVAFVEWCTEQVAANAEEGTPARTVNRRVTRRATIETFVPMRIFNRMVREREQIKARGPDAVLGWEAEMVLAVWQLTEPDMTLDRLVDGLGYRKIDGLFARFFSDELQARSSSR